LYGCETSILARREKQTGTVCDRSVKENSGYEKEQVTGGWGNLHNEEPHNCALYKYYLGDQTKEDEMGGRYITHKKAKVKLSLYFIIYLGTIHEGIWGSGGTALPFLTSALDGSEWSVQDLCLLTPRTEPPVPIGKEASWAAWNRTMVRYITHVKGKVVLVFN
jgi:hypothetical protein